MSVSRRRFLAEGASVAATSAVAGGCAVQTRGGESVATGSPETTYAANPVGRVVVKKDKPPRILLFDRYAGGLLGLAEWSHVYVLWWFDRSDMPGRRGTLQVHPRGDRKNPLTGVFACRAPVRPNLIGLTVCKVVSVEGAVLTVDTIDAYDGTPVLDLKPFTPADVPREGIRVPEWARGGPRKDG